MASPPYSITFKVRGYELDPWGHVNNAVYLNWLEYARWELAAEGGFMALHGNVLPVVRHLELDYQNETLLGDTVRVTLWPRAVATTSFTMGAAIRIIGAQNPERVGKIALLAKKVFVCVQRPHGKAPVPDAWRSAFPNSDPGPNPPD